MPRPERRLPYKPGTTIPSDPGSVRRGLWYCLQDGLETQGRERHGAPGFTAIFTAEAGPCAEVASWINGTHGPSHNEVPDHLRHAILDGVQELVTFGILRPDFKQPSFFHLTQRGRACLAMDLPTFPLDAAGVADEFTRAYGHVAGADVMARYLGQAVQCVQHRMNLAGAVMIGCAFELALYQLADAIVARVGDGTGIVGGDNRKALEAHLKRGLPGARPPNASDLIDAVAAVLKARRNDIGGMQEWVDSTYGSVFYYVRTLRNAAGHPSGKDVDLDDVFRHVGFFSADYRAIRTVIEAVDKWT